MPRRIALAVAVHGENGDATWYMPGDVPTAEHAALITNPKAWAEDDEPEAAPEVKSKPARTSAKD